MASPAVPPAVPAPSNRQKEGGSGGAQVPLRSSSVTIHRGGRGESQHPQDSGVKDRLIVVPATTSIIWLPKGLRV